MWRKNGPNCKQWKRGSTRSIIKEKIDTKCFKTDRLWWKNELLLGQIISGTKCDTENQFISAERGKMPKEGSIPGMFPTTFKHGSVPPPHTRGIRAHTHTRTHDRSFLYNHIHIYNTFQLLKQKYIHSMNTSNDFALNIAVFNSCIHILSKFGTVGYYGYIELVAIICSVPISVCIPLVSW